jgi:hypothetical protein
VGKSLKIAESSTHGATSVIQLLSSQKILEKASQKTPPSTGKVLTKNLPQFSTRWCKNQRKVEKKEARRPGGIWMKHCSKNKYIL